MGEMTNLLFDFDGTLHDTIRIYAPAFQKAYDYLAAQRQAPPRSWREDEVSGWLGLSSKDMWNTFMPDLPQSEKEKCSGIIGAEMLAALKSGRARLYDGVPDMLRQLKQDGYNLIFLSNCKISYMQESIRQFTLYQYFSAFYCTEHYDFKQKPEIFRDIAANHKGAFVVIGDRHIDMQIAEENGLPAIGCRYGYGSVDELKSATVIVDSPRQIVEAVRQISEIVSTRPLIGS